MKGEARLRTGPWIPAQRRLHPTAGVRTWTIIVPSVAPVDGGTGREEVDGELPNDAGTPSAPDQQSPVTSGSTAR
jgi:hypothetical protein